MFSFSTTVAVVYAEVERASSVYVLPAPEVSAGGTIDEALGAAESGFSEPESSGADRTTRSVRLIPTISPP
jgi:hypothetical protein